jgi:hypothetical protein
MKYKYFFLRDTKSPQNLEKILSPAVSNTPAVNEKNFDIKFFHIL